ncbi:MAG: A/G-specific adenine glycosylase [Pseudomonadota bacterium]
MSGRTDAGFSERLLAWYGDHGRNDLPWQQDPTPYRVWVSEIMLQQTRVSTVIPYYMRFMQRFPDVEGLAAAAIDQVLHQWTGLGYYARARHLYAAAVMIRDQYNGVFPEALDEVLALPGIGRSTAGAILTLSRHQRHPILDGNVKRVLARFHAVDGWPGKTAVQKQLWMLAEQHTPVQRVAEYTQAIMDLGATLCRRGRPDCELCPLATDCRARLDGRQAEFPSPRPRKPLPVRETRLLLLYNEDNEVLLERRPPSGIWGGLWSLPELGAEDVIEDWCANRLGMTAEVVDEWPVHEHTFSHFRLDMQPVLVRAGAQAHAVMDAPGWLWYKTDAGQERGLAAPVAQLLQRFNEQQSTR